MEKNEDDFFYSQWIGRRGKEKIEWIENFVFHQKRQASSFLVKTHHQEEIIKSN